MIRAEYEDHKRHSVTRAEKYFLKEIHVQNVFNWTNANITLNSSVTVITGKNGTGKSTIINALKHVYEIQKSKLGKGILVPIKNHRIELINYDDKKRIIENNYCIEEEFDLPELYDLTFSHKNYSHYKNTNVDEMNTFLETVEQYPSISISPPLLRTMREILTKQIIYAERKIPDDDIEIDFYLMKLEGEITYNSYTMGSGEYCINQFLWNLESVKRDSIVIIEEPEVFLHPTAQKKIMELIYEYSLKKHIQFIITTHSTTIIDHIRQDSLILIQNSNSNILPTCKCPAWIAKEALGKNNDEKVIILLEDNGAYHFFKVLISQINPTILKKIDIKVVSDGESGIRKFIEMNKKLSATKAIGVLDGDMRKRVEEEEFILYLPGDDNPENILMSHIYSTNINNISRMILKPVEIIEDAFNSAKTISNFHEWISNIGEILGENPDYLWDTFMKIWWMEHDEEANSFYSDFEILFASLTSNK